MKRLIFIPLAALALLVAGCTLVGEGDLHIANDESGLGADNTIFRAFVSDSGDDFPPDGFLNVFVRGDDFGRPPDYGMNGYLYLVRTDEQCPMSEGAPEAFTLDEVEIMGIATVTDGTVNQFFLIEDTPGVRDPTWALIELFEVGLPEFPGEHAIERCGEIDWS
jgi:hypothetical protein